MQGTMDPNDPRSRQIAVSPCDEGTRGRLAYDIMIYDNRNGELIGGAYVPGMKDDPFRDVIRK